MEPVVRVGLIGYGFAGRTFHAPVIVSVPGLRLDKVVERSGNESAQRYPWVEAVRSVQQLLEDDGIDLVVVATPSTNHYDIAKAALEAGKHVVVEKPFTATSAEADELIELSRSKRKIISVYHNRRWDGDFLTVQHIVDRRMLGELTEYEAQWNRYAPQVDLSRWREGSEPGAGVLYDLGVHLIDQALCLFGLPRSVQADVRIQREGGRADDYFELVLFYDRLRVRLKSSRLAREAGPRYVLHGTGGSFVKYGIDPQEEALKNGLTPLSKNWGVEAKEQWGTLNASIDGLHFEGRIETKTGGYERYYQNILGAIAGREELIVKPEQARNAIRVIELAKQSSELKRAVDYH